MLQDKEFDPIEAEKKEAERLIDKGFPFTVKKQLTGFLSKKKERTFIIKESFLGTRLHISNEFLKLPVDQQKIEENSMNEAKLLSISAAKPASRIIALSVLNNQILIRLFTGILALYFRWRLTPSNLFRLSLIVFEMQNYGDFINSIRFLHATRVTAPTRIEEKPQA